ncbi:MAG: hypothetical protein ACYCTE_03855 [Acidimicrobiales bacterium]
MTDLARLEALLDDPGLAKQIWTVEEALPVGVRHREQEPGPAHHVSRAASHVAVAPVLDGPPAPRVPAVPAPLAYRPASRGERVVLACLRWAESRDAFYRVGYYPHPGWGDGGGAFQVEPTTHLVAARLAGLPVGDVSAGAQYREALVLLRRYGTSPWAGDGCSYARS